MRPNEVKILSPREILYYWWVLRLDHPPIQHTASRSHGCCEDIAIRFLHVFSSTCNISRQRND